MALPHPRLGDSPKHCSGSHWPSDLKFEKSNEINSFGMIDWLHTYGIQINLDSFNIKLEIYQGVAPGIIWQ